MSAGQSDLSDPKFGYDLVVAVTQASVNATMAQFLAGLTAPEVVCCYVFDASNNLVPIDYATLKSNAQGSDPFAVPAGTPTSNQDLVNLSNASFAGAVKAQLGLPNLPPASLPPIVTLGNGTNAPVLFNLLCSEFQIVGFDYGPHTVWINQAQPDDGQSQPWYFSANVSLNNTTIDPKSSVPPAVQQRVQELMSSVGPNAFSIQQLFLDLDTAILESQPTIDGIPEGWAVWNLIAQVFLGAYFTQLRQSGEPVLGYSVALINPEPATLQLGAISHECCALQNDGQPISNPTSAEQNATTLVYLGTAATTPPTAVTFPWNWVELGEVSDFSGVQSVRRALFFEFLAGLLNADVGPLCLDTTVVLSHDHEDFHWSYTCPVSSTPASFTLSPTIGQPGGDGFTDVLSLNFSHPSGDSDTDELGDTTIYSTYNYSLTGSTAINGNQFRIVMTAQTYMKFEHREVAADYTDLSGCNYYDKTLTATYTLGVDQTGHLAVTETHSLADNSVPMHFTPGGALGFFGAESALSQALTDVQTALDATLDSAFAAYVNQVTDEINGYQGWVFPGASSFVFKDVAFSSGQDLVSQLTYANPD